MRLPILCGLLTTGLTASGSVLFDVMTLTK